MNKKHLTILTLILLTFSLCSCSSAPSKIEVAAQKFVEKILLEHQKDNWLYNPEDVTLYKYFEPSMAQKLTTYLSDYPEYMFNPFIGAEDIEGNLIPELSKFSIVKTEITNNKPEVTVSLFSENKSWLTTTITLKPNNSSFYLINVKGNIDVQQKLKDLSPIISRLLEENRKMSKEFSQLAKTPMQSSSPSSLINSFKEAVIKLKPKQSNSYIYSPALNGPSKKNKYYIWIGTLVNNLNNVYYCTFEQRHYFAFADVKKVFGELRLNMPVIVIGAYNQNTNIQFTNGSSVISPILTNCYVTNSLSTILDLTKQGLLK
jgi:hypothetical protein